MIKIRHTVLSIDCYQPGQPASQQVRKLAQLLEEFVHCVRHLHCRELTWQSFAGVLRFCSYVWLALPSLPPSSFALPTQ